MNTPSTEDADAASQPERKRKLRIGSQRDVANRNLAPEKPKAVREIARRGDAPSDDAPPAQDPPADKGAPVADEPAPQPPVAPPEDKTQPPAAATPPTPPPETTNPVEPEMSLEDEIEAALGGMSIEKLMEVADGPAATELEPESRVSATITRLHGDDVFLKLTGRMEGVASLRQFRQPPSIGQTVEVVVQRFNEDEGLYEVALPGAAVDVADWSDLTVGAVVECRITKDNAGGLEGVVNGIRAFIPASQVALYRVEQFSEFIDQKWPCVVTEADPQRRRLVLSRRAVLEREQQVRREELLRTIAPGQLLSGVVTKLMDFGAFVDVGGLEGLVHVSKLSWDRVGHPSEVLKVGERIKVKVEKIAEGTGKLSLSYRDTLQDPWESVEQKFPAQSNARGVVTRIAQFGAFVKLAPGIEGLIHISELAHHRVVAVKNVVNEGDEVEVKILSIDRPAQRISLSLKATQTPPERAVASDEDVAQSDPARPLAVPPRNEPLKGGRDRKSGGEDIGLHW